MARLAPIEVAEAAAWYRVEDEATSPVERLVASTPDSRDIVNRPEIYGTAFTTGLRRAASAVLASAPFREGLENTMERGVCVLHILRGGLSFSLREALDESLGMTRHGSAFLSSQRVRAEDGTWSIHEDLYRKLDVPDRATLVVGDVVATGTTLEYALEAVEAQMAQAGRTLRRIILFTIGCAQAEATLARCDARLRAAHAGWEGATVVYLEGRFTLAGDGSVEDVRSVPGTDRTLSVPQIVGTDLMRLDALLAPELLASQDEDPAYLLERCAVYDAGSRAFDVPRYLSDVLHYWRALGELALEGFTLREALADRWRGDHPLVGDGDGDCEGDAKSLGLLCARRILQIVGMDLAPAPAPTP